MGCVLLAAAPLVTFFSQSAGGLWALYHPSLIPILCILSLLDMNLETYLNVDCLN